MQSTYGIEMMVDDIIKRESKLSEWEQKFIQSISEYEDFRKLSQKQRERIELIWDETE